jgi:7-keto-8-aminopelargonate synthetase-like enzyme
MNYFTETLPGRMLISNQEEYLWFSGTSYLGIPHHPQFKQNFADAVNRYGTSWGSSRNNTVQLSIYEKAEMELAHFAKMPAALTVSSGMWAGQLVINFLKSKENTFWFAPKTHPALWNGIVQPSKESYQEWALNIASKTRNSKPENIVICSDSVGSPYVEKFDFEWINNLPANKRITIVIDASHSLGINLPDISKDNIRLIITSSLNKAMGMPGGVIFSDEDLLNEIRQFSMFSGASPMMPALLEAFVNSVDIFNEQRIKLFDNLRHFNKLIDKNPFLDAIADYPVYCTHRSELHDFLKEHKIMTACFPYPTVTDLPIIRLVISALHSKEDLEKLASAINSWNHSFS